MDKSNLIECWNDQGEPRAVDIDKSSRTHGWVFYKHPAGQWVTLRKATEEEMRRAEQSNES